MRLALLLIVLVTACDRATAPRAFTLGPGCWGIAVDTVPFEGGHLIVTRKGHWAVCPDPMPTGYTFWHWDTTYTG